MQLCGSLSILWHCLSLTFSLYRALLVAHTVKNLLTIQETWVWSLGWKDPLEKEMATHSSPLAWRIPWTEEPGGLQSTGSQRVGHDWVTSLTHSASVVSAFAIGKVHGKTPFYIRNSCTVHFGILRGARLHVLDAWYDHSFFQFPDSESWQQPEN